MRRLWVAVAVILLSVALAVAFTLQLYYAAHKSAHPRVRCVTAHCAAITHLLKKLSARRVWQG